MFRYCRVVYRHKSCCIRLKILNFKCLISNHETRKLTLDLTMKKYNHPADEWIETSNGNRVSKSSEIRGGQKIILSGFCVLSEHSRLIGNVTLKSEDEAAISMGLFCLIGKDCTLKPPQVGFKLDEVTKAKIPVHGSLIMGSFVSIQPSCNVNCLQIGRRVIIGRGSTLSRGCELGDVVIVDNNINVPEKCKIPSYTRVSQHPIFKKSVVLCPLPGSVRKCIEDWCRQEYLGLSMNIEELLSGI